MPAEPRSYATMTAFGYDEGGRLMGECTGIGAVRVPRHTRRGAGGISVAG